MTRNRFIYVALLSACWAFPASAAADLAQTIQADLAHPASGVAAPQVTVGPPVGDAALVGPGTSVNVTMAAPIGTALQGILVPSGAQPLYSTTSAYLPVWDLAVVEAIKHALANGDVLESFTITRNFPGVPSSGKPDLIWATAPYQPPGGGATMTMSDLRTRIQQGLPPWAGTASVDIAEDAALERVVTVALGLQPATFQVVDVSQVLTFLIEQQLALAPDGANIGRVIFKATNSANGDPLYTGVGDAFYGFRGDWYSPLVAAFDSAFGTFTDPLSTLGSLTS